MSVPVEEQPCHHKKLDLPARRRRPVIDREHQDNKDAELPGRGSHGSERLPELSATG